MRTCLGMEVRWRPIRKPPRAESKVAIPPTWNKVKRQLHLSPQDLNQQMSPPKDTPKSWEELPPGGEYTDTVPMRYEGESCGAWVQQEDESWERE